MFTHNINTLTTKSLLLFIFFSSCHGVVFANPANKVSNSNTENLGSALDSDEFKQFQQQQDMQNKTIMGRIGDEAVARAKALLPRLNQAASGIVHGKHVTVSEKGDEIVWRILSLPKASPSEKHDMLVKLQEYASLDIPEALNFLGFASEHGVFGARRNMSIANRYYSAAAARNYQPALLNLGLSYIYGKGVAPNQQLGLQLLAKASAIGPELSNRVCGMASFVYYRRNDGANALKYANGCASNLASLSLAAFSSKHNPSQRVILARDSLSSGVDSGLDVITKISQGYAAKDATQTYCKYQLVKAYIRKQDFKGVNTMAESCYRQIFSLNPSSPLSSKDLQAIKGLSGFPVVEIPELRRIRKANQYHYSWGVPFLPFTQLDVNVFEPQLRSQK